MPEARFHSSIHDMPADAWDALRPDDNPFVSHAFLALLEDTGCIRADWGWQPYHVGLYEREQLIAAAPLYLKGNSHGEFVFDWSWASAWERAGGQYYPKLLNAVPYSPVPGPRLLAGDETESPRLRRELVNAIRHETDRLGLSSAHANFLPVAELAAFDETQPSNWLTRSDIQFHWNNRGYTTFTEFLAALSHKKRKNIRHERAQVAASTLNVEMRSGSTLSAAEWLQVHELYLTTFDMKGNHAALTAAFFARLGELGDQVQVAMAQQDGRMVAMALFLQSERVLYGRYWGALGEQNEASTSASSATDAELPYSLSFLHFELCYYQGIEHCIRHGLQRFEPGAQGQRHKMARGFMPAVTHSRHYIAHEGFREAVRRALDTEADEMRSYQEQLLAHSPYADR